MNWGEQHVYKIESSENVVERQKVLKKKRMSFFTQKIIAETREIPNYFVIIVGYVNLRYVKIKKKKLNSFLQGEIYIRRRYYFVAVIMWQLNQKSIQSFLCAFHGNSHSPKFLQEYHL